jgi:hypothetical protein
MTTSAARPVYPDSCRRVVTPESAESGPCVTSTSVLLTTVRNYTGGEGRSFEFDNQVLISSHRKLLWSKVMVVNVAEKSGHEPVRHGRERRA